MAIRVTIIHAEGSGRPMAQLIVTNGSTDRTDGRHEAPFYEYFTAQELEQHLVQAARTLSRLRAAPKVWRARRNGGA